MSARITGRQLTVVALSAALLLSACDRSDAGISSSDLSSPESAVPVNSTETTQTSAEGREEPRLTSIPRVEEDRTTDRYLPPNAVVPDPTQPRSPSTPSTSVPDDSGNTGDDDGFPTATSSPVAPSETGSPESEPTESETGEESGESPGRTLPGLPPLEWPDTGDSTASSLPAPSVDDGEDDVLPEETAGDETAETGTDDGEDTTTAPRPSRSWVPVEPTEADR